MALFCTCVFDFHKIVVYCLPNSFNFLLLPAAPWSHCPSVFSLIEQPLHYSTDLDTTTLYFSPIVTLPEFLLISVLNISKPPLLSPLPVFSTAVCPLGSLLSTIFTVPRLISNDTCLLLSSSLGTCLWSPLPLVQSKAKILHPANKTSSIWPCPLCQLLLTPAKLILGFGEMYHKCIEWVLQNLQWSPLLWHQSLTFL